jgi:FkbM family methyltransferase
MNSKNLIIKSRKRIVNVLRRGLWHVVKGIAYQILPRGSDVFIDIRRYLPNLEVNTVFDVGAYIGKVAKMFAKNFPKASVYCFEPVPKVYQSLITNTHQNSQIRCFLLALSDAKSAGRMRRVEGSALFTLEDSDKSGAGVNDVIEEVLISTLDLFCLENDVTRINYLKIDAGGHDFSVLKGAQNLFAQKAIDVVEVEAGMNPDSKIFSRFEEMKLFLEERDYRVFAIYEQVHEFPTCEPHLRRTNAVFISREVINKNVC